MSPRVRRLISALGPVLLYGAAIVFVSGQSKLPRNPLWDKATHFLEYALLGVLVTRAVLMLTSLRPRHAALVAIGLAIAFGGSDELHQHFVPGRDASYKDLFADALGATAGAGSWVIVAALWRKWSMPR